MATSYPSLTITLLVWLCVALHACGDQLKSFSELDCGVLWFVHIPKVAGGSIYRDFRGMNGKNQENYWTTLDVKWNPVEEETVSKVMAGLEKKINETASLGKPRVAVLEHANNPSFADFFPELQKLNKTLTSAGQGCRVSIFTEFRDPLDRLMSDMHWHNQWEEKRMTSPEIREFAHESQDFMIKFLLHGRPYDYDIDRVEFPKLMLPDWPPGPATPEMVEKVVEMLSYFDLVGDMSQRRVISDGIHTILSKPEHKFPPQPKPSIPTQNKILKYFDVTDSDMAYICKVNKMDLEFHRRLFPGAPRTCDEVMKRMH